MLIITIIIVADVEGEKVSEAEGDLDRDTFFESEAFRYLDSN